MTQSSLDAPETDRRFQPGEPVLRREVLLGRPWIAMPTICVEDSDEVLALYLPSGAQFGFTERRLPAPFEHPWRDNHTHWYGHGKLMLQRPGEAHSVDVFFEGQPRRFAGWYFNLQDPFRRTPLGVDTLDHELDLWWPAGADRYEWKDVELFAQRITEGRYPGREAEIRAEGDRIAALLDAGQRWWHDKWSTWVPDPAWTAPDLPPDWETLPSPPR
jgi:hypothetical protein